MNVASSLRRILSIQSPASIYWKPIVTLLIITPILTELLTNNIPVTHLFEPELFLLMATLVYGPVLLLRELAIRWNLKVAGYLLLGLAYGIYNEGLLGRTIFKLQIANTAFDHYGIVWGFNLPWAAVIITFHAFYAFLFPILIVYYIFPDVALKPWINKRLWIGISIISFSYVSYKFLKNTYPVTPLHYVVLIGIMTALIILASFFKGGLIEGGKRSRLWLLGTYGIVFVATTFTVSDIIIRSKISFIFFLVYAITNLLVAVSMLNNKYSIRALLIFAFAAQLGFAVSTIIVAVVLTKSEIGIITSSAFVAIFAAALLMMVLKSRTKA